MTASKTNEGQGAETLPATKLYRILVDGLSAGIVGMPKMMSGQVHALPMEVGDILVARKQAELSDEKGMIAAIERGKKAQEKRRQNSTKAAAENRMITFDTAPEAVRLLARELGDEVVDMWMNGATEAEIVAACGGRA